MAKDDEMVVDGATIKCSMGDKSATLKVTINSSYKIEGKKAATIADVMPGANLFPPVATFGTCKPFKAAPPPGCLCTPIPTGPWTKPFTKKLIKGQPAIKGDACVVCSRGGGMITFEDSGQTRARTGKKKVKCSFCGKVHQKVPVFKGQGNHIGNSRTLSRRLMKLYGVPAHKHPLSSGKGKNKCAEAHHLICSESMNDSAWEEICSNFGYDINSRPNGIMLPSAMSIACNEGVPVHQNNHDETVALPGLNYVESVKQLIEPIASSAFGGDYCDTDSDIIEDLNSISKNIWNLLKTFAWTISSDGRDYAPGNSTGCLGVRLINGKAKTANHSCPKNRKHKVIVGAYWLEPAAQ